MTAWRHVECCLTGFRTDASSESDLTCQRSVITTQYSIGTAQTGEEYLTLVRATYTWCHIVIDYMEWYQHVSATAVLREVLQFVANFADATSKIVKVGRWGKASPLSQTRPWTSLGLDAQWVNDNQTA